MSARAVLCSLPTSSKFCAIPMVYHTLTIGTGKKTVIKLSMMMSYVSVMKCVRRCSIVVLVFSVYKLSFSFACPGGLLLILYR